METDLRSLNKRLGAYLSVDNDVIELPETGVVWINDRNPQLFVTRFLKALDQGRTVALLPFEMEPIREEGVARLIRTYEESGCYGMGPEILILTGGSGGTLRFVRHCWETLISATIAFGERFTPSMAATVITLPLYHVSGLMAFIRALVFNAPFQWMDYRTLIEEPEHLPEGGSLSLVPTQLSRWLESDPSGAPLKRLGAVLLGGAKLSEGLALRCHRLSLPIVPCYGMTETAAMVCALESHNFNHGVIGCGSALPHASIWIDAGQIALSSESLCYGYWPDTAHFNRNHFLTGDKGFINEAGSLVIEGRMDRLINTGGEKVDPVRIERVFEPLFGEDQVHVLGIADPVWGERVVAVYKGQAVEEETLVAMMKTAGLQRHECPKDWIHLDHFPRSTLGKLLYARLKITVEAFLKDRLSAD